MKNLIIFGMFLQVVTSAYPATINVPLDQPTIQAGIDAAANGDTVLDAAGTYTGTRNQVIDTHGKAVAIVSKSGPAAIIIDNDGRPWGVFILYNGEDSMTVIDGYTLTGTSGGYETGTVICRPASPTIRNCVIDQNDCYGIYNYDGAPHIENCRISYNASGGIYSVGGIPIRITDSEISNNGLVGVGIYWGIVPLRWRTA